MKKLLILPAILMLTVGCGEPTETLARPAKQKIVVYIDTIRINGHPHEFLISSYHEGQIMHSPECWCGKEVE